MKSWAHALHDRSRYEAQLEHMAAKVSLRHLRAPVAGPSLQSLLFDRRAFARRLAAAVANRTYQPRPATIRHAMLDKPRALFVFEPPDLVVHGVVAQLLVDAMQPLLADHLYSYRRGRSPYQAVARLSAYVRRHVAEIREPKRRGIHVFHCDVKQYGDSIPLHAGAPIWSDLRALLGEIDAGAWQLVEEVVRPEVLHDGAPTRGLRGLPTGSPITAAIANLYLVPLDRRLETLGGAFVTRYGDDICIAHPDAEVVRAGMAHIADELGARGLEANPKKSHRIFWNGAGRADDAHPEARPSTHLTFLGCHVGFDGTVGLPRAKLRVILAEVRQRIRRSSALLGGLAREARGRAVVAAVAQMFDVRSLFAGPHASILASVVSDRRQLEQLDYLVGLAAAEAMTGRTGVRAFREVAFRELREWGLPSLVQLRNGHGRHRQDGA